MKKALFIISGKAKYIPDLIHIHIQDHGKLINGEFGGVIIVCEFFNRSLQVFYLVPVCEGAAGEKRNPQS